eukprot:CAMPEP_0116053138 /NCGR_PEP_ID=MMETSP0322-20121206/2001_1 /TAXON_ID=163516 /ORGANISM="Leptocylindrus danicus var. apora, Strain B651" /LENGTH=401 /DNA_ID=CAMNT_0003536229 /DNA_START=571 /DNA_END=1776 /DNA_ORIENTATION=-
MNNTKDNTSIVPSTSSLFPETLYNTIINCERRGLSSIISFAPHGRSFTVHNPKRFETEIMLRVFTNMSKYASFQRQLNLYGFRRIHEGPDSGGYWHRRFLRGRRDLVLMLKRRSTSAERRRLQEKADREEEAASGEVMDPAKFYKMPPIPPCPDSRKNEISASSAAAANLMAVGDEGRDFSVGASVRGCGRNRGLSQSVVGLNGNGNSNGNVVGLNRLGSSGLLNNASVSNGSLQLHPQLQVGAPSLSDVNPYLTLLQQQNTVAGLLRQLQERRVMLMDNRNMAPFVGGRVNPVDSSMHLNGSIPSDYQNLLDARRQMNVDNNLIATMGAQLQSPLLESLATQQHAQFLNPAVTTVQDTSMQSIANLLHQRQVTEARIQQLLGRQNRNQQLNSPHSTKTEK